ENLTAAAHEEVDRLLDFVLFDMRGTYADLGTASEIADAAVFLGSAESSYVTAADLVVDGGWASV
ncbi:MAG: SDR family oxidoreductase, partial [Pseudomonadota bacterium]